MTADLTLGSYEIDESNGSLVIRDQNGNTVLQYDGSQERWEFPTGTPIDISELIDGAGISHTGELKDAGDDPATHASTHESGGSDEVDHGGLVGLGDDDHTQYLLANGTRAMSGALDMGQNPIGNISTIGNDDYNEAVRTTSAASGTVDVDLSAANWHEIEADGDITISFSGATSSPPGNSVVVYLEDTDGTGPHSVSWPASVVWSGGNAVTEIPSGDDVEVTLISPDGGSEWRGRKSGEAFT